MRPTTRKSALLAAAALAAATLAHAQAMPDLQRGLKALETGDYAQAEADLVPLAEQGYLDARLALGKLYAAQPGQENLEKALHWYKLAIDRDKSVRVPLAQLLADRGGAGALGQSEQLLIAAYKDHDPRALRGLVRLYAQYPQMTDTQAAAVFAERAARSRDIDDRNAAIQWYRAHVTSPVHAEALMQLCREAKGRLPECYVDLARHYRATGDEKALDQLIADARRMAGKGTMQPETVERLARALTADDIAGPPRPQAAYGMLQKVAKTSLWAQARMGRLLMAQPELDADADPEKLLAEAAAKGSIEAKLDLGKLYLEDQLRPAEPAKAQALFTEAAALPQAQFYLGRIAERGYLGSPDPQKALEHYLEAARRGYGRADLAIAHMYSVNRGVRVNLENAYAFATLAVNQQVNGSAEKLEEVRKAMSRAQLAKGSRIAEQEFSARRAAGSVPPASTLAVQEDTAP